MSIINKSNIYNKSLNNNFSEKRNNKYVNLTLESDNLNKYMNNKGNNIKNKSKRKSRKKYKSNKDLFMIVSVVLSCIINIQFILPFWSKLGYSKNVFIQTIFITVFALTIYILFNVSINNEEINIYANKFIVIYILFLIAITFFKARTNNMVFILDPLNSIWSLKESFIESLVNIFGNLVMYIPIGIYIKYKFNNHILRLTFIFLIYILLVEFTQGITKTGVFDMNDVVTNTLGFVIGMKITPKF